MLGLTWWFLRNSWTYMTGQRRQFFLYLPRAYWKFMQLESKSN